MYVENYSFRLSLMTIDIGKCNTTNTVVVGLYS